MAGWLKGCEVCNAELVNEMRRHIACGMSERRAAKELEKQQEHELGTKLYSAVSILSRYKKNHPCEKVKQNASPVSTDTCAVSDLSALVSAGKKFGTIYADPPWSYSNQGTRAATNNHYVTMTVDEIASLPVRELSAERSHLHLWTTNAFLFECPKILEAWGFEYKGAFVWVKPQMGIGNYWRVSHEFLLLGVRGGLTFADRGQMSWLRADRTRHSSKPEEVSAAIEKVSPGPWLEMFGRRTRKNWTVWGNEIKRELFNAAAFNG